MLKNVIDPESFQFEKRRWELFKNIRENDVILRDTILE